MRRIWLAAAEASGDALGARLARVLRLRWPEVELRGLAGPAMRGVGVVPAAKPFAGAVGLVEALDRLPRALALIHALERDVARFEPDVVCTIDSPSLLLRLARRVGRPVVHWVAPQVWAWRPGRARRIARSVDTLCCLLPFEPEWFRDEPVRAVFTGHPAATAVRSEPDEPPVIALLPGSRAEELRHLWPAFRDVAAAVARHRPEVRFRVGCAPGVRPSGLAAQYADGLHAAVRGASAALVCSGTATLEVAAQGVPQVAAYRTHPVTWHAGRRLVRLEHVALPNVLAGRAVIPEHLQDLDVEAIAADLLALLDDASSQRESLAPILASLEPEGAVERVADELARAVTARRSSPRARSRTG